MSDADVDIRIDARRLDSAILEHPDGPPLHFVESYSGIRGHFGDQASLSAEAKVIALAYGYAYAANVIERWSDVGVAKGALKLVVGRDPRPTGALLAKLQRFGFALAAQDLDVGLELLNLGVVTTPLIQAAVRGAGADGGVISTGSHNPIEDNGLKYLTGVVEPEEHSTNDHGAVLNGAKMGRVIRRARALLGTVAEGDMRLIDRANETEDEATVTLDELAQYRDWVREVFRLTAEDVADIRAINARCGRRVVADANGGGGVDIVPAVLEEFVDVVAINGVAGSFPHSIEPVGDALDDAIDAIEEYGAEFGVVFDADADRGNLVLREVDGTARELAPQDVAMLNVAGMLAWVTAHADRYPEMQAGKLAVVAHGATSERVAAVARRFGAELVEVETGEVNVVARMRELTREGYFVPVGVEGSNGGTVFHGAVVRDGTLTALMALLVVADARVAAELHVRFRPTAEPADGGEALTPTRLVEVLDTLPTYHSIQANLAVQAAGASQAAIKEEFERLVLAAGAAAAGETDLPTASKMDFLNYEETRVLVGQGNRESQTGGFKLRLTDNEGRRHFFWFRVSKTEAGLARVVADSPGLATASGLFDFGRQLYERSAVSAARSEFLASERRTLLVDAKARLPGDLIRYDLPTGLDVVVVGGRDRARMYAGNLIAALVANFNRVRWVESLGERPSGPPWPDIVVAPDGEQEIASQVEALASAAGRPVGALYFSTLAARPANLVVGGDDADLTAVRQAVREHVSQTDRTDYVAALGWQVKMAVAHADLAQLWSGDDRAPAANLFLIQNAPMGQDWSAAEPCELFQIVAPGCQPSTGFVPLHVGPGQHVMALSPHPDDAEIAAGLFLRQALRSGATVHNVVHSGGDRGVTDEYPCAEVLERAGLDADALGGDARSLKAAVRLLEVEAAAVALARGLTVPENASAKVVYVEQLALDTQREDDRMGVTRRVYRAILERHMATAEGAPWIVVLPHPEDAHPTHRATTARALAVLKEIAAGRVDMRLVYYRAPWSGSANTYFLAERNEGASAASDGSDALPGAVTAGKQALAILVGELVARRFGLAAPSPEEMGGGYAEEFRRALVQP